MYPGATEEEAIPLLEEISGLKYKRDFKVGYSPERINPGDKLHTLATVVKVVSGCDDESLETIAKIYEMVVTVGVHKAPLSRLPKRQRLSKILSVMLTLRL